MLGQPATGLIVIKSLFFVLRILVAWFLAIVLAALVWDEVPSFGQYDWPITIVGIGTMALVFVGAVSHLGRVRLVAGRIDQITLANRQRRRIEIPLAAGEAFDLMVAAIGELPRVGEVESARDSLQIRAKVARPSGHGKRLLTRWNPLSGLGAGHDLLHATVLPGQDSGSVTLICEPEAPVWSDWFLVDDGNNFQNAEAITRAISQRVAALRRSEKAAAEQTATEKELAIARLSLLHAQVEPHFLYNTLTSAQLLARIDPPRADQMLGHLIQYLRHSLPDTEDTLRDLGTEIDSAVAYLEILKIRMGPRLSVQIDVSEELRGTLLPPMVLQTLVENAIKHGLEPRTGGGTVSIMARRSAQMVEVTVADDGAGFNIRTSGTGIGLKNARERLRLVYGERAKLAVTTHAPAGVVATLTVPAEFVRECSP